MQRPHTHKAALATLIALITHSGISYASGYGLNEYSGSAMGSAYAGAASNAEDASIAAYNPAGIALLKDTQLTLGSTLVTESGNLENAEYKDGNAPIDYSSDADGFQRTTAIPFGHFSTPLNDKWSFGASAYAPYGMNLNYDDDFAGRFFGDKTQFTVMNLQGTLAYQFSDTLAVGFGLAASMAEGKLTQNYWNEITGSKDQPLRSELKGDDIAPAWNIGLIWQPTNTTTLGLAYHSSTKFSLEGTHQLSGGTGGMGSKANGKHDVNLDITMPEKITFSITQELNDRWTILADASWTRWSRFENFYIEDNGIEDFVIGPIVIPDGKDYSYYIPENWRNTWAASIGAKYVLNDDWTLKAGYMYDQSPVTNKNRTARTPDANRQWLTVGAKWQAAPQWTFDFAAGYVWLIDGTVYEKGHSKHPDGEPKTDDVFTGEYKNQTSWLLSAQMTYHF